MALDKELLKAQIKQAFLEEQNEEQDHNASLERIASKLSNAVDAFVRSGIVTVAAGISVTTAGTATTQTGATTSTGVGTIS